MIRFSMLRMRYYTSKLSEDPSSRQWYTESNEFLKEQPNNPMIRTKFPHVQKALLDYVLRNAQPNNPQAAIDAIDLFCSQNWMMNVGDQKSRIVSNAINKFKPKTILEIGGYCGYSALFLAHQTKGKIHTIEISQEFANIANQIHRHAGVANQIEIHIGTVETSEAYLKEKGPFDMTFIDHEKDLYLPDFTLLFKYGVIGVGSVTIGDNIFYPGAPDYLEYFKKSKTFQSTLYHSHLEYSDVIDGVLVSERIY